MSFFLNMWTDKLRATDDLEQTKLLHFVAFLLYVFYVALYQMNQQSDQSAWLYSFVPLILCVANRVDFFHVAQSMLLFLIYREPFQECSPFLCTWNFLMKWTRNTKNKKKWARKRKRKVHTNKWNSGCIHTHQLRLHQLELRATSNAHEWSTNFLAEHECHCLSISLTCGLLSLTITLPWVHS